MRAQPFRAREVGLASLLAGAVVLLRLALARPVDFCGTPDACFYLGTAQTLASGGGFHARFLYDFQQPHLALPNTGIEYWRPGISFLLLLLRPFGGVTLHGAILLTTLVGVLFAAAAWHIALHTTGDRRLALGSFALCLLGPSFWNGSLSPDSGLFYGAAVAWFLALFTVRRQGLGQDLLALLCVGLAYLIRNDAVILLLPLVAVLLLRHRHARRAAASPPPGSSLPYALAMLFGFVAVLAPMHALYSAVLGTAFPAGTARVFFLDDLSDFVRYQNPATLHTLLAHGLRHLLVLRLATLATVLYRIAALSIGYPALLFLPVLFARRHRPPPHAPEPLPELTGAAVFLLAALLLYTLVLPAIGQFSALRTAESILPLVAVCAILGLRRAAATPHLAALLTGTVLALYLLAGIMNDRRDVASLRSTGAHLRAEAAGLAALGAHPGADPRAAVVLTGDPVQFSVTTGFTAVALPVNGTNAIAAAAHDFGATDLLIDTEALPGDLPALQARLHPIRSLNLPAEHTLILELPTAPGSH